MNKTTTTRKTILKGLFAVALLCAGFAPRAAEAALAVPKPTVSTGYTSYVTVNWGSVSGAQYYRLYRGTTSNFSSASLVYEGTGRAVRDWGVSLGYKYYYWVMPCASGKGYYNKSKYGAGYRKMTLKLVNTSGKKVWVGATVNGTALASLSVPWSLSKSGVGSWTKYRNGNYLGYFSSTKRGKTKFTLKVGKTVTLSISKTINWR